MIDLAKNALDERVRSVCLIAVLDRAGVQPIAYDPKADEAVETPKFDPKLCTDEELEQIYRAMELMADHMSGPADDSGRR